MKRILTTITLCICCIVVFAQNGSKIPVYVLPTAMLYGEGNVSADIFSPMITTLRSGLSTYPKTSVTNNIDQAEYVVGLIISGYNTKSDVFKDDKGITRTMYMVNIDFSLAISPKDQPDQVIKIIGPYHEPNSSIQGYEDALKSNIEPRQGRIRELIEGSLQVKTFITDVTVDPKDKKGEKADKATVNAGHDKGITNTQWFDVFVDGQEKPIGTLHAKTVNDSTTLCEVRDGKKEILTAFKAGTAMRCVSREERNIWKAAGRIRDKIGTIGLPSL